MDLLIPDQSFQWSPDPYFDVSSLYNQKMISVLRSYHVDGWRPAIITGKPTMSIYSDIRCNISDGYAKMRFEGIFVTNQFRIIVVSEDGKTVVSNIIDKKAYKSVVDFNYMTGKAAERPVFLLTVVQLCYTLPLTLLVEGIILLLFRFSLKRNWKPLLFINLCTQLMLTIVLMAAARLAVSYDSIKFTYILSESFIVIAEAEFCAYFFAQHSIRRRVIYAITANAASFLAGMILFTVFGF